MWFSIILVRPSPAALLNVLTFPPLTGRYSEGLDAFRFVLKDSKTNIALILYI